MTNSNILRGLWAVLENEKETLVGLYERRVFASSGFTVFAGLLRPSMNLLFSVIVPSTIDTDGLERETKGFKVNRRYFAPDHEVRITLELSNSAFREVFEVVAEDIASHVLSTANETEAVNEMRERLNHWERFLRASGLGGLNREEQVGLFGELLFLRSLLDGGALASTAVAAWEGPGGENQDYRFGNRGLEVKATTSNSSSSILISNELQLDETDSETLFLLHFWLREFPGTGHTLPQLVEEIEVMLSGEVLHDFADRLAQMGYHSIHRELYQGTGYSERQRKYYLVHEKFPRIRHNDLRSGVSKVKYQIDLAGFEAFEQSESSVTKLLLEK